MSSPALVYLEMPAAPKCKALKYPFTPAMDDEVRRAYGLFLDEGNRKAIGACAAKLQLPKWMVTRRAALLGLARVKEPAWSDEEVEILEQWGHSQTPLFNVSSRRPDFTVRSMESTLR